MKEKIVEKKAENPIERLEEKNVSRPAMRERPMLTDSKEFAIIRDIHFKEKPAYDYGRYTQDNANKNLSR